MPLKPATAAIDGEILLDDEGHRCRTVVRNGNVYYVPFADRIDLGEQVAFEQQITLAEAADEPNEPVRLGEIPELIRAGRTVIGPFDFTAGDDLPLPTPETEGFLMNVIEGALTRPTAVTRLTDKQFDHGGIPRHSWLVIRNQVWEVAKQLNTANAHDWAAGQTIAGNPAATQAFVQTEIANALSGRGLIGEFDPRDWNTTGGTVVPADPATLVAGAFYQPVPGAGAVATRPANTPAWIPASLFPLADGAELVVSQGTPNYYRARAGTNVFSVANATDTNIDPNAPTGAQFTLVEGTWVAVEAVMAPGLTLGTRSTPPAMGDRYANQAFRIPDTPAATDEWAGKEAGDVVPGDQVAVWTPDGYAYYTAKDKTLILYGPDAASATPQRINTESGVVVIESIGVIPRGGFQGFLPGNPTSGTNGQWWVRESDDKIVRWQDGPVAHDPAYGDAGVRVISGTVCELAWFTNGRWYRVGGAPEEPYHYRGLLDAASYDAAKPFSDYPTVRPGEDIAIGDYMDVGTAGVFGPAGYMPIGSRLTRFAMTNNGFRIGHLGGARLSKAVARSEDTVSLDSDFSTLPGGDHAGASVTGGELFVATTGATAGRFRPNATLADESETRLDVGFRFSQGFLLALLGRNPTTGRYLGLMAQQFAGGMRITLNEFDPDGVTTFGEAHSTNQTLLNVPDGTELPISISKIPRAVVLSVGRLGFTFSIPAALDDAYTERLHWVSQLFPIPGNPLTFTYWKSYTLSTPPVFWADQNPEDWYARRDLLVGSVQVAQGQVLNNVSDTQLWSAETGQFMAQVGGGLVALIDLEWPPWTDAGPHDSAWEPTIPILAGAALEDLQLTFRDKRVEHSVLAARNAQVTITAAQLAAGGGGWTWSASTEAGFTNRIEQDIAFPDNTSYRLIVWSEISTTEVKLRFHNRAASSLNTYGRIEDTTVRFV